MTKEEWAKIQAKAHAMVAHKPPRPKRPAVGIAQARKAKAEKGTSK